MKYTKSILLYTLSIFFCFSLTSCQKKQNINSISIAISSKPQTLDPRLSVSSSGMRIVSLLFSSFVKIDPNLKVVPDAAESWTYDSSKKTYTFRMKPNLKFSNGRPILAEDIKFSIASFQDSSSPFSGAFKKITQVNTHTDSNNQLMVSLSFDKFSAPFLSSDLPVLKILPKKEILESKKNFFKNPISSGPMLLTKEDLGSYHLAPNPQSFAPAKFPVTFKVIKDMTTLYQKAQTGEVDLIQGELSEDLAQKLKPETNRVITYPDLHMAYLLLNLKSKTLQERSVREAIAYGIDTKSIIQKHLRTKARIATSLLTPENPYFDKSLQPFSFNMEKAKKLLKATHKNTSPVLEFKISTNPVSVSNAQVISSYLKEIGFTVKIQSLEWGSLLKALKSGNYDISFLSWVGATDPDIYRIAFHSSELPPGRNRGFYKNKELDKLLLQGSIEENKADRVKIYNKVQKQILDELPIIPLWYNYKTAVISTKIKDYTPYANGSFLSIIKAWKK